MVFTCIFLMTCDTQRLFLHLFAICVFSLVKYLFKSLAHSFINWAVWLVIASGDLRTRSAHQSVQLYDLQMFSSALTCRFSFLMVSFKEQTFLIWPGLMHHL